MTESAPTLRARAFRAAQRLRTAEEIARTEPGLISAKRLDTIREAAARAARDLADAEGPDDTA